MNQIFPQTPLCLLEICGRPISFKLSLSGCAQLQCYFFLSRSHVFDAPDTDNHIVSKGDWQGWRTISLPRTSAVLVWLRGQILHLITLTVQWTRLVCDSNRRERRSRAVYLAGSTFLDNSGGPHLQQPGLFTLHRHSTVTKWHRVLF